MFDIRRDFYIFPIIRHFTYIYIDPYYTIAFFNRFFKAQIGILSKQQIFLGLLFLFTPLTSSGEVGVFSCRNWKCVLYCDEYVRSVQHLHSRSSGCTVSPASLYAWHLSPPVFENSNSLLEAAGQFRNYMINSSQLVLLKSANSCLTRLDKRLHSSVCWQRLLTKFFSLINSTILSAMKAPDDILKSFDKNDAIFFVYTMMTFNYIIACLFSIFFILLVFYSSFSIRLKSTIKSIRHF